MTTKTTYAINDYAYLKARKPLPNGATVRVKVRVLWIDDIGRYHTRGVTPGMYEGGHYAVRASELEA